MAFTRADHDADSVDFHEKQVLHVVSASCVYGGRSERAKVAPEGVITVERMGRDRLLRLDALGWIGGAVGVVAAALRRNLVEELLLTLQDASRIRPTARSRG